MATGIKGYLKDWFKHYNRVYRIVRLFDRYLKLRYTGHFPWSRLLQKKGTLDDIVTRGEKKQRVLLATSMGSFIPGMTLETLLGAALKLRGAEVHSILCDKLLPACQECDSGWYSNQKTFVKHGPQLDLCKRCHDPAQASYKTLGVQTHRYNDYISTEEMEEIAHIVSAVETEKIRYYQFNGLSIGEHSYAGTLRFFARSDLSGEPFAKEVLRKYFHSGLLLARALQNLFTKISFNVAVFHHGIYIPQGIVGEVARKMGVRVVNWNPAYRKQCFIMSHTDTYHHTLMDEPVEKWENMEWTQKHEEKIVRYLQSRWTGENDWIWFHKRPKIGEDFISQETGIDFSKPCIGMLTNVAWDAQLHYPANAFPNMLDWIIKTIEYFEGRPDLQLIIRVHPAEIRGTLLSRQPVVAEIRRVFQRLPKNVFVVPPESHVSTYALMERCDSVVIYGTKTGVELTSMGIPVVVAGEAWIRNKGITYDADSPEEYFKLLGQMPFRKRLDEATVQRARKYAYHFFFRRMIPLEMMQPISGSPPFKINLKSFDQLRIGADRGLDIMCDGILEGKDFSYSC